jgi:uncharacterized protein
VSTAYLDTSAVVKRYVRAEANSARVRSLCSPPQRNALLLGRATSVEVASALARRTREGTLSVAARVRRWRLFRLHWRSQYQVVDLTDEIYARGEQLLFRHPLRAYDALHVASALAVQAALPEVGLQFWTADRQQAAAARAEGLAVELLS